MSAPVRAEVERLRLPLDRLPDPLPIPVVERPFDATIRPPGSKSITNRALLLAALASGESVLRDALVDADDARVMIAALKQLGAGIDVKPDGVLLILGVGGRWTPRTAGKRIVLDLHNAGTATRFLAAAALFAPPGFEVVIDGDKRMRERPIGELVEAINAVAGPGAATYDATAGFPPVVIRGADRAALGGKVVRFGRTMSSQFISAAMHLGAFIAGGIRIEFDDAPTSEPYVRMTGALLERVGADVTLNLPKWVRVAPRYGLPTLAEFDLQIEPDASGATYWWAAGAIIPRSAVGVVALDARPGRSMQGDSAFVWALERMGAAVTCRANVATVSAAPDGVLRAITADLADMPDTAMTLAAACCFAKGRSTLRGLRTLRVKETDRITAIAAELTKIGAGVEPFADGDDEGLTITPPPPLSLSAGAEPVVFDTYHDHRMAMSLALIGLRRPGVSIRNPACVAKTYPMFWRDLARLYV